ncbi:MAG: putative toxin-antitoxin system toxin component, PIN family [Chloroflexi bacterium]|nr:putative toxin-antitoxin system toxin component, PIN family [Chloroflexota bacterium]
MGEKRRKIKRVVLDTNVIVSALLFEGQSSALVGLWKQGKIIPLVSTETLKEIIRVLAYPKFDLREEEIKSIINEDILPYVETVKITREIKGISSDAADDIFLTCALNGKAEAIISGDTHLLSLKEFEGIPISKITEFLT